MNFIKQLKKKKIFFWFKFLIKVFVFFQRKRGKGISFLGREWERGERERGEWERGEQERGRRDLKEGQKKN